MNKTTKRKIRATAKRAGLASRQCASIAKSIILQSRDRREAARTVRKLIVR